MKMKRIKKEAEYEDVEVELPYYFHWDHGTSDYESQTWGMITQDKILTVQYGDNYHSDVDWKITTKEIHRPENIDGSYFYERDKSSEKEFLENYKLALEFVKSQIQNE